MNFETALCTDKGIRREINQDSLCLKQAETSRGAVLMAVICDGMGGLAEGEVASATVMHSFAAWFETRLPSLLLKENCIEEIRNEWRRLIKEQNQKIAHYGQQNHIQLGTTITALLILENDKYINAHVGDSRTYKITNLSIEILTKDQTVVAREIRRGHMTAEEAERDPRRNVLLQCIGASKVVEPDFVVGQCLPDECYMLCSDGFRHKVTLDEIEKALSPANNTNEKTMKSNIIRLIELNKEREETDNISAILIKTRR